MEMIQKDDAACRAIRAAVGEACAHRRDDGIGGFVAVVMQQP